jgi:hypothetical protein
MSKPLTSRFETPRFPRLQHVFLVLECQETVSRLQVASLVHTQISRAVGTGRHERREAI